MRLGSLFVAVVVILLALFYLLIVWRLVRWVYDLLEKCSRYFQKNFQGHARNVKIVIQGVIGIVVVGSLGWQVIEHIFSGNFSIDQLDNENLNPLRIVGVGLLYSTAVELGYLLFTHGPDEAIDPIITGVAALLLIRAPIPTDQGIFEWERVAELGVYGVIIASLVLVRGPFFKGEQERRRLEGIRQSTERDS